MKIHICAVNSFKCNTESFTYSNKQTCRKGMKTYVLHDVSTHSYISLNINLNIYYKIIRL